MEFTLDNRLAHLLAHLNIERAHFAGRLNADWQGLATNQSDLIESLALVCPPSVDPSITATFEKPLFVVTDADGRYGETIQHELTQLPTSVKICLLSESSTVSWSDLMYDKGIEIMDAYQSFLSELNTLQHRNAVDGVASTGEVSGISYRIYGEGPPLILMPLFLSPSNWRPVVEQLAQQYQVIVLGGRYLGAVAVLECRGESPTYLQPLKNMLQQAELMAADCILEVGCGSGVLTRFVYRCTNGVNAITGVDLNEFLLAEAESLAKAIGPTNQLEYRAGNALALPFEDAVFDFVYSVTVIEECNAQTMLAELSRVTKPGGYIAVICRATDLPFVINLDIDAELKERVQTSPGSVSPGGCADSSLYSLVAESGLDIVDSFPSIATFHQSEMPFVEFWEAGVLASLSDTERKDWYQAKRASMEAGTFFLGWPHHCVLGRRS